MAEVESFVMLGTQDVGSIARICGSKFSARTRAAYVMLALAVFDYALQRCLKRACATAKDIKEESKAQEGDPHIKARIRSIMREMARKRMMQDVPKATVVVTNPTHLAIALVYRREEMVAPQVVAKGAGYVAERIKAMARSMPSRSSRPAWQQLFKTVDIKRPFQKGCIKPWRRFWRTCTGWSRGLEGDVFTEYAQSEYRCVHRGGDHRHAAGDDPAVPRRLCSTALAATWRCPWSPYSWRCIPWSRSSSPFFPSLLLFLTLFRLA